MAARVLTWLWLLSVSLFTGSAFGASEIELAMEPPVINTNPGPQYSDEQRDYAMVIGMDRTSKGRIWAAWVAGGDSDLGYFVAASSDDNGTTWSKPRLVIDPPEAPSGLRRRILVGTFWTDPTGKLWLFFDQSMGYYDGRGGSWAITCDNPDSDKPVWSAPRRIWHGATLNKPLVLKNGEWLMPISLWTRDRIGPSSLRDGFKELDDLRMANLFVSTDQGATWNRRGGVRIPYTDFDEHMFVELKDGRLWLLARTKYGIAESFSSDTGRTWTEPKPSSIQNVSARFFLRRLASGNLLLVKNGPLNIRLPGRSHMMAFLSDDEGSTWKGGLTLDERDGVSYPDGFQDPDGTVRILYDRNRAKDREILMGSFTEADVLAGKIVSTNSQLKQMVSKAIGASLGKEARGPKPAPVKIIFDTDMQTDCDDAAALAVLHTLARRGEAEIIATVVSVKDPASVATVDA
ncbi:MAG TPA: exo-alpha-sialidase, partial [Roseimicrobium sp.]|nr:exo-alpha-sialidase [Roseimicrobium sp.]